MQLAGHLKGRARQEWCLIPEEEKNTYKGCVEALRFRLDPGSKALAAQDFRHASQNDQETVSDFIRWLEKIFRRAYGNDTMLAETRDVLLYAQLQEELKFELMKAPAVSGALDFQALCVDTKSEERRLAELHKRRQYSLTSPTVTRGKCLVMKHTLKLANHAQKRRKILPMFGFQRAYCQIEVQKRYEGCL